MEIVHLPERTETGLITESDQTGGPCIAALAGFPHLKESVSHAMAQFLIILFIYGWCYVIFSSSFNPAYTQRLNNIVTMSMQPYDIGTTLYRRHKSVITLHRHSSDVVST